MERFAHKATGTGECWQHEHPGKSGGHVLPGMLRSKHSQHPDLGPLASPTIRGKCLLVLVCGSGLSEHRLQLNLERVLPDYEKPGPQKSCKKS